MPELDFGINMEMLLMRVKLDNSRPQAPEPRIRARVENSILKN